MARSGHPIKSESETKYAPLRKPTTNAHLWYFIYDSLIIVLSALSVTFWVLGAQSPLLYPFDFGQWLLANPKISTIIWTACGSVLAAVFMFLLKGVLILMSKQRARSGTTLSTVEGWNKCANEQPLLDSQRALLSGFTVINWLVALTLTTAFTTLLTPTSILVSEAILGDEVDFTAPEFLEWYNLRDADGIPKRKIYGCTRYTYNSSLGSINFPTCPFADDPVACISAGVSAAQESLGAQNASVRVVDSLFKGSTGGVLPLGFGGISAFSNVGFESWPSTTKYPHFNYTLSQQGLSAEISCHETPGTPIQSETLQSINVTNSAQNADMLLVKFSVQNDYCDSTHTWLVPSLGIVAPTLCQPDENTKKYELFLASFGKYSALPNMACSIEPIITKNVVTYSTTTGLFTSTIVERLGGSAVPNETAEAVSWLFMISITSWGSGLIDSVLSLNTTGKNSRDYSYRTAIEDVLRGIVEYEGSTLRIYYSANEAAGRSTLNGTYNVFRMGYNHTQLTSLLIVLPFIAYLVFVSGWYTIKGLKTGVAIDDTFDPTDSAALVTAAAVGASSGKLDLGTMKELGENHSLVREVKRRYAGRKGGLVTAEVTESNEVSSIDA